MKLRFSIRDLLWVTLMVALVACWRLDRQLQEKAHKQELNRYAGEYFEAVKAIRQDALSKVSPQFNQNSGH